MTEAPTEPNFPLKEFLGLTIERDEGTAAATLLLQDRHMNPNAVAHGAVAFTLMDTAMGAAVMTVVNDDQQCATIEMQTRFHRPAASGPLVAEATVLSAGKRVIHLQARTTNEAGDLIASASASFAIIGPEPAS